MIARKVYYWGRVQGVGFRYTAREIAAGFAVAGYVRNLDNGEVELLAQGDAAEVDLFLAAIDREMKGNIHGRRTDEEPVSDYDGFEIRRT